MGIRLILINAVSRPRRSNLIMIQDIRTLAAEAVPRYTSYPTAPHFSAQVGHDAYADWLAALPASAALSFYVHVPFCAAMCRYCGCHTKVVRRREPVEAYADRLAAEAALLARTASARNIVRIHWGGGTPSMLGSARLIGLVERFGELFDVSGLSEHAIELDPRHVTGELAAALRRIGINRASLGVQDFSPHVQAAIERIQPFELVAECVARLSAEGIEHINLDLMYGLPEQREDDVCHTARLAHSLAPSRLALFGYAHVPWFKSHQRLIDAAALPGAGERLGQAQAARRTLLAHGYQAVGLDHFALPHDDLAIAARGGALRRNFQGYTTDRADALIGLGASAISTMPIGFAQNAADIAGYSRAIASGRLATSRGIRLTPDDRRRGAVIERLMCDFAVDLDGIGQAPDNGWDDAVSELGELVAAGMVTIEGRRISMTEQGRPLVRLAAAAFDAYRRRDQARHAAAV
jgi:oxygen-independent coproporphyrinogen-3 oxidase